MKPVTVTFDADKWKVAPRKATTEMRLAGQKSLPNDTRGRAAYAVDVFDAMLDAAPSPPALRVGSELYKHRHAVAGLVDDIDGLIAESSGVYGLHLNGDPAPWDELVEGGRFERLTHLQAVRELLNAPQPPVASAEPVPMSFEQVRDGIANAIEGWPNNDYWPATIAEMVREIGPTPVQGCTRSHPHENMSPECEAKTIKARKDNEEANKKYSAMSEDAKDAEMLRDLEIPFLADLLSVSIANLGYPVGCGIPLSQEHAKKAATALFDRFVSLANAMQKGAVSTDTKDAALKLARDALDSCQPGDYSTGHVIAPSFDEQLVSDALTAIDAMQKGGA